MLTVSPNPTTPSSTVNVTGTGLDPRSWYRIRLDGTVKDTLRTTREGTFSIGVAVGSTVKTSKLELDKKVGKVYVPTGDFVDIVIQNAAPPPPPPPPPPPFTDLQNAINATPAGGFVNCQGGEFGGRVFTVPRQMTIGDGIVDGGGARLGFKVQAAGVIFDGMEVRNTQTTDGNIYQGAIDSRNLSNLSLLDCYVHHCVGHMAVWLEGGGNHVISGGEYAYAEPTGVHPHNCSSFTATRVLFHHNNIAAKFDAGWEAGGLKVVGTKNAVIDACVSHDNNGPGIWFDVNADSAEIMNNRTFANRRQGIQFEISNGAKIHGNAVYDNGAGFPNWAFGAGILVSSSSNAEVYANTLARNADGICVIAQAENGSPRHGGQVGGSSVHNNAIIGPAGEYLAGFLQDYGSALYTSGNGGHDNTYWGSGKFAWNGDKDLTQYNSTPGEENGRYLTDTEKAIALAAAGIP